MDLINKFREAEAAKKISLDIHKIVGDRNFKIMEVCGGQTHTIYKYKLKKLLPNKLKLISGPGCPVCVTPIRYIDQAIHLAINQNVKIFTFGDLIRVPGTKLSLEHARAKGAFVQVVYSANQALKYAAEHKNEDVVFLGIGFETTIPNTGLLIKNAYEQDINNLSVLLSAKRVPPVLNALLSSGNVDLDGFITPGHVTTIIGSDAYNDICKKYSIPMVVGGFEPIDLLLAIRTLAKQIIKGTNQNLNEYKRVSTAKGNSLAIKLIEQIFEPINDELRGLGIIPNAGYKICKKYEKFDALKKYNIEVNSVEPKGCICGRILSGLNMPEDCKLFRNICTPDSPVGSCMVSSEGTCNAAFLFGE